MKTHLKAAILSAAICLPAFAATTPAAAGGFLADIVDVIPQLSRELDCCAGISCKRLRETDARVLQTEGTFCKTIFGFAGPGPSAPLGSFCQDIFGNVGSIAIPPQQDSKALAENFIRSVVEN